MPKRLTVTAKQEAILQTLIRGSTTAQRLVTRAKIVMACTQWGRRNQQIAEEMGLTNKTVSRWRGRWEEGRQRLEAVEKESQEKGALSKTIIDLLSDKQRSGAPATFTAEQICQIIAVACESPALSERPITEWSPRELAEEVMKRGIVESISRSQVRLFLKRGGIETASKSLLAQS